MTRYWLKSRCHDTLVYLYNLNLPFLEFVLAQESVYWIKSESALERVFAVAYKSKQEVAA